MRGSAVYRALAVLAVLVAWSSASAFAQPRTPAETVDAFHRALAAADTAGALSLLARDLVVYEFGVVDPTVEAYAFQHLPIDMDVAIQTQWDIEARQVGGEGSIYWVLTTYRITGTDQSGGAIDVNTMETVILRRVGELFRIVHFHWSTDDPDYLAQAVGARTPTE